jgi:hypothetical protein
MSTTVKIYSLQPQLDVPAQSRIRFPLWLKCLYNIAQMELTTLDPLGAFYLVALDADWKLQPQNIMARGAFCPRLTITMPTAYPANASSGTIGAYSIASRNFELQQRVSADLHSAICSSLCSVILNEINSKHQCGTGSLTPLNLVTELKTMFGTITKQEIDATQALISAPLAHFLDFCNFCSNIHLNYELLIATGHAILELTRIDSFTRSIEPFTQFDSYLTTWTTSNALGSRTLGSLTKFLLEQYGDMPTEHAPRGGDAFYVGKYGKGKNMGKGKGKGKDQDKGKRGSKRTRDADNNSTSLPSFASSSTDPRLLQPNTAPPNPTVIAGSTDGISLITATSANGSLNPTTRRASTPLLLPVSTPLATLTSNPRTNYGGFEKTRKKHTTSFTPGSTSTTSGNTTEGVTRTTTRLCTQG